MLSDTPEHINHNQTLQHHTEQCGAAVLVHREPTHTGRVMHLRVKEKKMETELGSADASVFLHECVQLKVIAGNINEIQAWAALIKVRKHTQTVQRTHAHHRSHTSEKSIEYEE